MSYNPSAYQEEIFIRVEDTTQADFFTIVSFELEIFNVEANPVNDIEVCLDTDNTGITQFDLTTQSDIIFGANQTVLLTIFLITPHKMMLKTT